MWTQLRFHRRSNSSTDQSALQGKGGGVRRVGRSEPVPEQGTEPPLLVRCPELSFWVLPQKKGHREEDVFKI